MNRTELINAVATKTDYTKSAVKEVVEAVFDVITEEIADGNKVNIVGFGTFNAVDVAERVCKNPRTGDDVISKAHRTPRFKASSTLRDSVR